MSARLGSREFLVTPTGSHLGLLGPRDLLRVDRSGRAGRGRVTSEWPMHLALYEARPDIGAVFHAHPPHVVARSLAGLGVDPAVLPEVAIAVGPVAVVPYETTGTGALASAVAAALVDRDAAILERHGVVCVGPDPILACARVEVLEHAARILGLAPAGVAALPAAEQARLAQVSASFLAARTGRETG